MGAMASQITSHSIVYPIVYPDINQRKHQKLRVTGLFAENSSVTGEFLEQMASNAENVSIWWRYHVVYDSVHQTTQHGFYSSSETTSYHISQSLKII